MANVPLREVVTSAHQALEAGDYTVARAACQHILTHFPSFADMHRLVGEIMLEQGETEGARQAFERALSFDPQNVLATLGLGVIAEESLDLAGAAAAFQRALEIDPSLTQLRDELVRLYGKLYGQGGRLHISGAGLAAIYARGNQLTLARRQYEQELVNQPERLDLALGLAEMRWRSGDLAGTQQVCQQVLAHQAQTVRALYLQADLYRRAGAGDSAAEHFARAAAIDPLLDIARGLEQANPAAMLGTLMQGEAEIAAFDPTEVAAAGASEPTTNSSLGVTPPPIEESEWLRLTNELGATVAAAEAAEAVLDEQDFQWPWETEAAEAAEAAPAPPAEPDAFAALIAADEAAPAAPAEAEANWATADWDQAVAEIEAARPANAMASGYTDTLREFDALGFKPFDAEPTEGDAGQEVDLSELAALMAAEAPPPPLKVEAEIDPAAALSAPPEEMPVDAEAALRELVGDWDSIDLELQAATPSDPAPVGADLAGHLGDIDDVTPFAIEPEREPRADSLGAGWDEIDTTLSAATPDGPTPRGFTRELQDLDDAGFEPFSFEDLDAELARQPAPPPPAPLAPPTPAPVLPTPEPLAATWSETLEADRTWADLEAELTAATPGTSSLPPGFTAELHALTAEGLLPFEEETTEEPLIEAELPPSVAPPPPAAPVTMPDLEAALGLSPMPSRAPTAPPPPAQPTPSEPAASPPAAAAPPPLAPMPPLPMPSLPPLAPMAPMAPSTPPAAPPRAIPLPSRPPAVFGSTISLSGALFDRLRGRKQELIDLGHLEPRPVTPAAPAAPVPAPTNLAVQFAEAASDAQPADPAARLTLATALAQAGQTEEAAMAYRLLLRTEPAMLETLAPAIEHLAEHHAASPRVMRLLGDLYLRQGRYGQAIHVFRSLLVATSAAA